MMELTTEARKAEIIAREKEHNEIKARADRERHAALELKATEKDMRIYNRQLIMVRKQRKDEYRREVVQAKISMQEQRTMDLQAKKDGTLTRRRVAPTLPAHSVLRQ